MNIPTYPHDFHECRRSKRLSDKQVNDIINDSIKNMINFMTVHGTNNHSVTIEDLLIIIDRIQDDDEYYYEVSVTKEHYRIRVKI